MCTVIRGCIHNYNLYTDIEYWKVPVRSRNRLSLGKRKGHVQYEEMLDDETGSACGVRLLLVKVLF